MLNLPPRLGASLNSAQFANLHTFWVVARHLSFSLAARELCLTPSAVSHRIRRLEQALSLRLFERLTRKVRLTEEGERVFMILQGVIDELSEAVQQSPGCEVSGSVALYSHPSVAACWLVPRLADFHERYPQIALDIRVGNDSIDFRTQTVDLLLLYANGEFPGLVSHRLMDEHIAPICSPAYARKHRLLEQPENLRDCTLLHDAHAWENAAFDAEWRLWAQHNDQQEGLPAKSLTFDRSDLCVSAAMQGAGIALGRQRLVQRHLDHGELILPLGGVYPAGPPRVFPRPPAPRTHAQAGAGGV